MRAIICLLFLIGTLHAQNQIVVRSPIAGATVATITDTGAITGISATLSSSTVPITLSNAAYVTCTALTSVANVVTCTVSDKSVKQGFHRYSGGMNFIRNVQPQSYSFREGTPYYDHGRERLGLIAQDVARSLPLAVIPIGNGLLQVDQAAVQAATISAVQSLDAELQQLKAEVRRLRAQLRRRH